MGNLILFICVFLWGLATFLNRISVEKIDPVLLQTIVAMGYIIYLPIAFRVSGIGNPLQASWSLSSIILTLVATACGILANVMLYTYLRGNDHTGSSTMFISLYPVVTLILSIVFLHETFTTLKVVGVAAMIVGAVCLSMG